MSHVGLKAERLRPIHHFQQFHHVPPAMHAAPANFAFGGQPLAMFLGDGAGFAECLGDAHGVRQWILGPLGRTDGRIDAHHAILPDARSPSAFGRWRRPCGPARRNVLLLSSFPWPNRRRSAATPAPRPNRSASFGLPRDRPAASGRRRWNRYLTCGCEQKQIDAVEVNAIHLGRRRQIEHRVQIDGRLRVRALCRPAPATSRCGGPGISALRGLHD